MQTLLRNLIAGEDAQDLIEYALLASLLSIISVVALTSLGTTVRDLFNVLRLRVFPNRI
jgi:Flp pilus assembly pilin Flp